MKTAVLNTRDIQRNWLLLDADSKSLGRVAATAAKLLMGKHKPVYSTHHDTGDHVIIVNAEKVALTGNKAVEKEYFSHSTYPGGGRIITFRQAMERDPAFPLRTAIKGMLPKTSLGRKMIKKLFIYSGEAHPHEAQKPKALDLNKK